MDRVAMLAMDTAQKAAHHKRRAHSSSGAQKRGSGTKVPRTDSGSDGSMMDVCCTQTSDSAQSTLSAAAAAAAAAAGGAAAAAVTATGPSAACRNDCCTHPDAAEQLVASEECEFSGSEVEGPVVDKYIKGTRLIVNGWFQACRGCNEPTAHTSDISARDVPLCPRCQQKYNGMVSGEYPHNVGAVDTAVEPLSYWLPRMLGSMPRMEPDARRNFCDQLVLRQDDAWLALIKNS